ncbi:MAG: NAD(+)/NADH kinase [Chloroflexota bacterium]
MGFNKIVVCSHPNVPDAASESENVANYLKEFGVEAVYGSIYDPDIRQRTEKGEFDLFIALGGDGTMLRAGHLCAPHNLPILGINLGRFGFLTEFGRDQWKEMIPRLINGEYWIETRMMLRCEHRSNDIIQGGWEVVNEAVVGRGVICRPVQLTTYVDQRLLTTFVADGLIVATPTGSTAYALAAGGPILPPELRNILIVPLAPHLSIDRSIILSEGASVSIIVHTQHQSVLCVDGKAPIPLQDGDRVDVRAGSHMVKFVRFQDPGYFYRNLTPHMNQNPSTGITR